MPLLTRDHAGLAGGLCALVALLALGLTWQSRTKVGSVSGGMPTENRGHVLAEPEGPSMPAAERVPIPVRDVDRTPAQEQTQENAFGFLVPGKHPATVRGLVWGAEGELLPFHRIAFEKRGWVPKAVYSDDSGAFVARLPAGEYEVLYYGLDSAFSAPILVGALTVEADSQVPYDVVVVGECSLSGNLKVSLPPEPGALAGGHLTLRLELRMPWDPDRLIASGETEVPRQTGQVRSEDGSEVASPATPDSAHEDESEEAPMPRAGDFRFTGLVPDVYLLRIILGETEQGDPIYIDRTIDLSGGDLSLPPETLSPTEFRVHPMSEGR